MDTKKIPCLDRYISALKDIYGEYMRAVILYGSYARGDYTAQSDIDIMLLVDMPEESVNEFFVRSSDMTYDFNLDNHVEISLAVKTTGQFYKWADVNPFYKNVREEGQVLYEAAG